MSRPQSTLHDRDDDDDDDDDNDDDDDDDVKTSLGKLFFYS